MTELVEELRGMANPLAILPPDVELEFVYPRAPLPGMPAPGLLRFELQQYRRAHLGVFAWQLMVDLQSGMTAPLRAAWGRAVRLNPAQWTLPKSWPH